MLDIQFNITKLMNKSRRYISVNYFFSFLGHDVWFSFLLYKFTDWSSNITWLRMTPVYKPRNPCEWLVLGACWASL